jgi:hypothetical protein
MLLNMELLHDWFGSRTEEMYGSYMGNLSLRIVHGIPFGITIYWSRPLLHAGELSLSGRRLYPTSLILLWSRI